MSPPAQNALASCERITTCVIAGSSRHICRALTSWWYMLRFNAFNALSRVRVNSPVWPWISARTNDSSVAFMFPMLASGPRHVVEPIDRWSGLGA